MDDLDRQLLGLLRNNARTSVATLAKRLGVARGTVQNRLIRMERDGTITGYTVLVRQEAAKQQITALMLIAVEGNQLDAVTRALRGEPGIRAMHTTNGRWDLVADVSVDSIHTFDQLLSRVRLIGGISGTETTLLLGALKL
jgi:DNA-binding Lrp family transcriptional regulator